MISAALGDVADVTSGIGFPKDLQGSADGDVPVFKVGDISDAIKSGTHFLRKSPNNLSKADAHKLSKTLMPAGTIVFAKIGEGLKLNRRAVLSQPSLVDNNVMGLVPKAGVATSQYLYYFMQTVDLGTLSRATAVPSVRKSDVVELPIPLPPIVRQDEIVAELEKQFSRLDEAGANLQRVKANLKRYKASVLKDAVEGRLVPTEAELARREGRSFETGEQFLQRILAARRREWKSRGKYKMPIDFDGAELKDLPEGWSWASVDQLAAPDPNSITDGPFGSNLKSEHYQEVGPRVIRLQNIKDGEFADAFAHISTEHFDRLAKHQIFAGDLVIASLGESPPRACVIPPSVGLAIVKADCIRFKPHPELSAEYLNAALNCQPTRMRMKDVLHGIGRPRLSLGEIRAIALPIPPVREQARIHAEVDRRVSLIRSVESAVNANLRHTRSLRQSILTTAFGTNTD